MPQRVKDSTYCSEMEFWKWVDPGHEKMLLIAFAGHWTKNGEIKCYSKVIGRGHLYKGPYCEKGMFQRMVGYHKH